jgi:hypothetical protein
MEGVRASRSGGVVVAVLEGLFLAVVVLRLVIR